MNSKFNLVFLLIFCSGVNSASVFEKSYDYFMNLGKSLAPNFLSVLECVGAEEPWGCAREKAGEMLDAWEKNVDKERKLWEEEADAEVRSSGRSLEEMPSKIGREITDSLGSLANILETGVARALQRKHDEGGIDSITISTGGGDRKKMKKKKTKPPKIHLIHPMVVHPMRKTHKEEKGRNFGNGVQSWVIGERSLPENSTPTVEVTKGPELGGVSGEKGRGLEELLLEDEELENEQERDLVEEQRGKKKKKKKAILKLLVLGAVIKAKIATLLQILTYKLQIKFFIIALLSLAVNIARLWLDLKNKNNNNTTPRPQKDWRREMVLENRRSDEHTTRPLPLPNKNKIIYYEHAQHQHHYDHEEEEPHGWGPWARSIFPLEDSETEVSEDPSPYRAQERAPVPYKRPFLTRV